MNDELLTKEACQTLDIYGKEADEARARAAEAWGDALARKKVAKNR